jgi:alkylation response protein AidB-like acyl-CoA dehydrogenase
MDFNDTPEEAAFRKEVRAWLDANATRKSDDKQSFRARNDDPELLKKAKEWQDKKALAGYARISWPKEYGGRGVWSGCWCGAAARCSAIRTQDQDRGASSPPPYRRSMPCRC